MVWILWHGAINTLAVNYSVVNIYLCIATITRTLDIYPSMGSGVPEMAIFTELAYRVTGLERSASLETLHDGRHHYPKTHSTSALGQ